MAQPTPPLGTPRSFVILAHERPDGAVHYDLMIETPGDLWTWSFPQPLARRELRCRRIPDHPRRFLSYEGPLRQGLGSVRRVDAGTCRLQGDPAEDLALHLQGRTISGVFRLVLLRNSGEEDGDERKGGSPNQTGEYAWRPVN